jgi:hypothetical protein
MSRTGYIYKLYCDSADEFYVGSCWDMIKRKYQHKHKCVKEYDCKVYRYIKEKGGFDKCIFEILEVNEFENKNILVCREQHYISLLKPTLNSRNSYLTPEQRKQNESNIKIKWAKKQSEIKVSCPCGSYTDKKSQGRHEKSKKHQKYLRTIINII